MWSFVRRVTFGDNHERVVCTRSSHVAYENGKLLVGPVMVSGNRMLVW
jgi:hypothetical protein